MSAAAAEGHADVVRLLIENRADIRAKSTEGFTPLLFAVRKGDLNTARVLLTAGADVNEAAPDGTTPLVIATIRANQPLAEFLLKQGADPNKGPGFTPLHRTSYGISRRSIDWFRKERERRRRSPNAATIASATNARSA